MHNGQARALAPGSVALLATLCAAGSLSLTAPTPTPPPHPLWLCCQGEPIKVLMITLVKPLPTEEEVTWKKGGLGLCGWCRSGPGGVG